jgi:hypothetical protein
VFPLDYAEFGTRYGRDAIESDVQALTLASPEQVAEIKRLLGIVKVAESEIEKLMTKAGADSFEEFSAEQAASTIEWLKKRIG